MRWAHVAKWARALFAVAAMATPALAARYSLELKTENTRIEWTLADVLHTVHGTFNLKTGKIDFDSETGSASGQVVVDVASGKSGSDARDHRMHTAVLESAKYPEAVFVPDRVLGPLLLTGPSTIKLHGMFQIHGASHEVTVDVQTKVTADQIKATMAFDIPYVEWGMKDPSNFLLKVNKTVRMSIEFAGLLRK